jgi:holo-[acyl-carrier protein] synthase
MILGIGIDLVDLEAFRGQLADEASQFVAQTFTAGERRDAHDRPSGDPARHLAARFAAKEALIKAWSAARWGLAPALMQADLKEIEVISDGHGRPALQLTGSVAWAVDQLAGGGTVRPHVSLSHDGGWVAATVVLEQRP